MSIPKEIEGTLIAFVTQVSNGTRTVSRSITKRAPERDPAWGSLIDASSLDRQPLDHLRQL